MKRNIKIITMIALSFCALGCLLLGVGVASGGLNDLKAQAHSGLYTYTQDKQLIKGDITALDANLDELNLTIVPSEDEHFYLAYNINSASKKLPLSYYVSDDKVLTLLNDTPEKSRFERFSIHQLSLNLLSVLLNDDDYLRNDENGTAFLYVPKNALKNSTIEMAYGSLQLNNCYLDAVEAHLEYGDLVLANPQWQDARFNIEFGDVNGNGFKCRNNTRLDLGYGDVNLENSKIEFTVNMNFRAQTGDITVNSAFGGELSGEEEDNIRYKRQGQFNGPLFEIDNQFGDITLN